MVEEEVSTTNYTLVPGMGHIELPFSYKFFERYYPTCELQTKKWVFDNYKPDWISFDIGANIGYYSILFSKLAKEGFCYSFEPTDTYEFLIKNLEHNKVTNCQVNKLGIGNENILKESPIFKIWGKPPINNSFEFKTLDTFIEENNIKQVNLIKIDTDGYEIDILDGMVKTLEKFNPWLLIEFSYALNTRGYEVSEMLNRLVNLGYRDALVLDDKNLITKKDSINLYNDWSNSISLVPHKYNLIFDESEVKDLDIKYGSKSLDNLLTSRSEDRKEFYSILEKLTAIEKINHADFEKIFGQSGSEFKIQRKYEVNPTLKYRGPRMEVNDAPYLRYLYKKFQFRNHLEFGTWEGFGVANFCMEAEIGNVTTINLPEGELNKSEGTAAYSSTYYPETRQKFLQNENLNIPSDSHENIGWIYRKEGYQDRVKQIYANSGDLTKDDFHGQTFDSIFIDGDHSIEGVINDTKLALELLSYKSMIIWHDFLMDFNDYHSYGSPKGVVNAIAELIEEISQNKIKLYWVKGTWVLIGVRNLGI